MSIDDPEEASDGSFEVDPVHDPMDSDHSVTSDAEECNKDSVELNVFSAFFFQT